MVSETGGFQKPVDRAEWTAAQQFSYDLMLYLKTADEQAVMYNTRMLIEVCHVILTRLWWRILEKKKEPAPEQIERMLIEASILHNNGKNTEAHNKAKQALRELNNMVWKLDLIFKAGQDPGTAYGRGRGR